MKLCSFEKLLNAEVASRIHEYRCQVEKLSLEVLTFRKRTPHVESVIREIRDLHSYSCCQRVPLFALGVCQNYSSRDKWRGSLSIDSIRIVQCPGRCRCIRLVGVYGHECRSVILLDDRPSSEIVDDERTRFL